MQQGTSLSGILLSTRTRHTKGRVIRNRRIHIKDQDYNNINETNFLILSKLTTKLESTKVSEFDQEIPQSHTTDKLMAP